MICRLECCCILLKRRKRKKIHTQIETIRLLSEQTRKWKTDIFLLLEYDNLHTKVVIFWSKCLLFLAPNVHFFLTQTNIFLVEMICHSAQTWNTTTQSRLFLSSVLFYVFDFDFSLSNLHITTLVCKLSYSSKRKMSVFHFLVCSDNNLIVSICVCIFFLLFCIYSTIPQNNNNYDISCNIEVDILLQNKWTQDFKAKSKQNNVFVSFLKTKKKRRKENSNITMLKL
jgi:hypothetical protein